jgi:hypothetical protein
VYQLKPAELAAAISTNQLTSIMNYRLLFCLSLFLSAFVPANAQKLFAEGTATYKVKLESANNASYNGIYTFTIKGTQIRKELKLNNGYQDIIIINSANNTVYSLQDNNGKKYAIELSIADVKKNQEKYAGFTIKNETGNGKNISGSLIYKGNISYRDGSVADVYYIKEWQPVQSITFERFPDCKFFPTSFSYKDENNTRMYFDAEKIDAGPIDNGMFRIPADYKMISNTEYRQLSK